MNPKTALDDLFSIYLLAAVAGVVVGACWIILRRLSEKPVDGLQSLFAGVFLAWIWAAVTSSNTWLMALWGRIPKVASEWMKDSSLICGMIMPAAVCLLWLGILDARKKAAKKQFSPV